MAVAKKSIRGTVVAYESTDKGEDINSTMGSIKSLLSDIRESNK